MRVSETHHGTHSKMLEIESRIVMWTEKHPENNFLVVEWKIGQRERRKPEATETS